MLQGWKMRDMNLRQQNVAANSCLAFSTPAFLTVPHFHVSHFQSPHITINSSIGLSISSEISTDKIALKATLHIEFT